MVDVRNLVKSYHHKAVVNNVSFNLVAFVTTTEATDQLSSASPNLHDAVLYDKHIGWCIVLPGQ
jgi:hypothetical protein